MTTSSQPYNPWTKPDQADKDFQGALDQATPQQFEGFVKELLSIAEARSQQNAAEQDS